jgi:hypothetical protein
VVALGAAGCGGDVNAALEQLSEARRLSSNLLVDFTKADDASNRAVMADTDEASIEFATEADQSKQALEKDLDALKPLIGRLGYADEGQLLTEFSTRYAQYRELDRSILDLAVKNTNLKAQRLSFGPAQDAADAFCTALDDLASTFGNDAWRQKALIDEAKLGVREIQIRQGPHIADADAAVMSKLEGRMSASEASVRKTLETLQTLTPPAARPKLAAATVALDRFMSVNAQIIGLSRENTNVRSLILALNQKRPLSTSCEQTLRALQTALSKRGYRGAR